MVLSLIGEHAWRLHRESVVLDLHSDMPQNMNRPDVETGRPLLETHQLPAWRQGGIRGVLVTVGGDAFRQGAEALLETLTIFGELLQHVDRHSDDLVLVDSPESLLTAVRAGRIALVPHMEGATSLAGEIGVLESLYRLGLRSLGLTWNFRNAVADGLSERETGGGLTRFGREVVLMANRLGICLDVAHLAPAGFGEVLRLSRAPVVCSHANPRRLCDHPRNLTDDELKALAGTGGMLGVSFVPQFLRTDGARPTIADVVTHMTYVAEVVGHAHVGIGADFMEDFDPTVVARVMAKAGMETSVGTAFPEGLSSHADFPHLTQALLDAGWEERAIRGVLGENFLRVWRAVRGEAPTAIGRAGSEV